MPAPAFYLRLALLPLFLFACRTRDNPAVCTARNTDCDPGFKCDLATETCVPDSPTDVGRPETKDGPVGGMAGTDGPATDAGSGGCTTNAGCTLDKPICSPAGKCVTCTDPSHCTADPNKPACVENACISCLADTGICGRLYPATPMCSGKGACVECNISQHCNLPTAPICVDGKCTRCTSDSQCQDRNGANPGLCLAHIDGTCAKDADVIYVRASAPDLPCVDSANGPGSAEMPFCRPRDAIEQVAGDRRILLLRGLMPFTPLEVRAESAGTAAGRISVIGQPGATIVPGADVGVNVTGGDVFLRGLTISGGMKEGVAVLGEATVRLYACVIKNNVGGLSATGGAGFEVVNSVFDGNVAALLDGKTPFGAAYLNTPLAGRPGVFRFNTVYRNKGGVTCENVAQQLSSSLFSDNGVDLVGDADVRNCATAFSETTKDPAFDMARLYQLTDKSPCLDKGDPVDHPPDDWKGEPRPGGLRSDCGADELHQEPAP